MCPHVRGSLTILAVIGALAVVPATPAATGEPCADCHEVDVASFEASVHGFLDCTDCHADLGEEHWEVGPQTVLCDSCHPDVVEAYAASIHGESRSNGADEPPACQTCHGPIHTLVPSSDPGSPVHPRHLADTCGNCHADPEMVKRFGIPVARPLQAYRASVHERAVSEGQHGATCSTCHGSHAIFRSGDPRSTVFHPTVPSLCGTCHGEIATAFQASVHGAAVRHGVREAPVCTDCHGEHRILSPREADSPVFASNVPKMTCGRCHEDLRLAEKFGIAADRVPAYHDSYHGLAIRSGAQTVAHCGSCHGVHDILPSSDPRSHVHPSRLPDTCGACHPGAGQSFTIGPVHVLPTEAEHAAVYWIRKIYLWLIFGTIGAMLLHNLLDLAHKVRNPPRRPVDIECGERMMLGFRVAHVLMIASFALLVWSGFALKYPDAWWARPLLQWEEFFGFRGWLHRAAGILMMVALLTHLVHLAVNRRARRIIAAMRPGPADLRELAVRLRYLLWLRRDPPPARKLGYAEKAEYLALMWGIVVMALTGFLLWFDNLVLRWLPKWVTDVATVIHFYEAVLASLAIVVWHLYFVIFDPVVYPMDMAWLTGKESPGRQAEHDRAHAAQRGAASQVRSADHRSARVRTTS